MKEFDCNNLFNAVKFTRMTDEEKSELIVTHKIIQGNYSYRWDKENEIIIKEKIDGKEKRTSKRSTRGNGRTQENRSRV